MQGYTGENLKCINFVDMAASSGFSQRYSYCTQLGITEDDLLAGTVRQIPQASVPNGLILDLIKYKAAKMLSWKEMGKWLSAILGTQIEVNCSMQRELRKLRESEKALSRNKKMKKLDELRSMPVHIHGIPATVAEVTPDSESTALQAEKLKKETGSCEELETTSQTSRR